MADSSPLGGLLDRAGKVFTLAGDLARLINDERKSGFVLYDPTFRDRIVPPFSQFWEALLQSREEMENPPAEFASVAEYLRHAAQIATKMRPALMREIDFTDCLNFSPSLYSVFHDGLMAVGQIAKALRVDEQFAFLDKSPSGIDTTPASPRPPKHLIDAAERDIPGILGNLPPRGDGVIDMIASHLAKHLLDAKHILAAAHWAVHESVLAGRLQAARIETHLPIISPNVRGMQQESAGSGISVQGWSGGDRGYVGIPTGKPAPFEAFKVIATKSLWDWWQTHPAPDDRSSVGDDEEIFNQGANGPQSAIEQSTPSGEWDGHAPTTIPQHFAAEKAYKAAGKPYLPAADWRTPLGAHLMVQAIKYSQSLEMDAKNAAVDKAVETKDQQPESVLTEEQLAENAEYDSLSNTQKDFLQALLELKAIDSDSCATLETVVFNAIGSEKDPDNFKRAASGLTGLKLTQGKRGPGGGSWLTAKGQRFAARAIKRNN
ncbi:MAG: hypothetical protein JWN70_5973 [Planctomycetaceae bacterium]|nr:hypothetical protein [Planctomycetaceae bacterium]